MKEQEHKDSHHIKDNEYHCPFEEMADNPRYLYVHVSVFFAWGLRDHRDYDFLYDSKWHNATCRNARNGRKVRLPIFRSFINPDKMFRRNPKINWCHFDATSYFITMKSGSRERNLTIDSPDKVFYKPFYWIFDTILKDYGYHPRIERWSVGFVAFLCRMLKPFNIGWVNEIAESITPERELDSDDDIYTRHCEVSFELKKQAPSIKSQLNKFDPVVSRSSRLKNSPSPKWHGQRRNDLPRKRPPPR